MAYLLSLEGISIIRRIGFVSVVAASLAIAAPQGYWEQMGTLTSLEEDYNWDAESGRREVWIRGMGYMLSRPIFGIGLGNFGRAEGTISERARTRFADDPGIKWSVARAEACPAIKETVTIAKRTSRSDMAPP